MSVKAVKKVLLKYPLLGTILWPFIKVYQMKSKKKAYHRHEVCDYLQANLVQDPVLKVDDFEGSFALSAESDLFRRLLVNGSYESELVRICKEFIDPKKDIIDIGANVGFYSVLFAKSIDDSRKVVSIEPTKNALNRLYGNLKRNRVEDNVEVFEGVISNSDGNVNINVIVGKEEYSSLGTPLICGHEFITESVEAITLDNLVTRRSITPGFIKIDVEGHEMNVFLGSVKTLEKYRPIILSELSDELLVKNGSSQQEVIKFIEKYNYRVIDPLNPQGQPGSKESVDILCIPAEIEIDLTQGIHA